MNDEIESEKVKHYAEEGGSGLVDNALKDKKDKIAASLEEKFKGFVNDLTQ